MASSRPARVCCTDWQACECRFQDVFVRYWILPELGTQFIHLLTIAAEHLFSAMHRSGTCTIIQACVSSFVESKHSGPYERHVWTCHWLAYGNHSRASILLLFRDGARETFLFLTYFSVSSGNTFLTLSNTGRLLVPRSLPFSSEASRSSAAWASMAL